MPLGGPINRENLFAQAKRKRGVRVWRKKKEGAPFGGLISVSGVISHVQKKTASNFKVKHV